MRIFYAFIMIWCVAMIVSFTTSSHVGLFGPLAFIIFVLLFFWALKKYRKVSAEHRRRSRAWRNDPNNWSV